MQISERSTVSKDRGRILCEMFLSFKVLYTITRVATPYFHRPNVLQFNPIQSTDLKAKYAHYFYDFLLLYRNLFFRFDNKLRQKGREIVIPLNCSKLHPKPCVLYPDRFLSEIVFEKLRFSFILMPFYTKRCHFCRTPSSMCTKTGYG